MGDDLEARLKSHAQAFEGLLSLIPAKEYYGKDESITSTQWQKKKQTKAEWQANKRAKLDPASHKSAKDVLDENARKRKLEPEVDSDSDASSDLEMDIEKEKPLEGLKARTKKAKKQKTAAEPEPDADSEEDDDEHSDEDMQPLDMSGLVEDPISTATISSVDSNSIVSGASSASSIIPPTDGEAPKKQKEKKPLKYDAEQQEAFRARLSAKLDAMRAARKADGPDGRPARNRAELIETRRKKEAERKAAKKAGRQVAKEDEARLKAEEQLARLRGGSGSPSLFPLRSSTPESERNFNFGKIAWEDGQQLDSTLSNFLPSGKRKGASDPKTALEAAKKKQNRISGLDEQKRKDIEEKELWLAAKKRAQGEKVHDDVNLMKKTLKRQEKQKAKSKEEWVERLTNVEKGKEMKQKRREENLKKRRDESKKGKGKGAKKAKKPPKKVKRPGFEGTFKAR